MNPAVNPTTLTTRTAPAAPVPDGAPAPARRAVLAATLAAAGALTLAACSQGSGSNATMKVIIIAKSYQNQFYQAAFRGAQDAADELNVQLETNGPDAESNVSQQVEQLSAAVNQGPAAIALAACQPDAVQDALVSARSRDIPVIGFDSGVPDDASGAVVATATTDNTVAGGNVATNLAQDTSLVSAVTSATADSPAVIGVLAQDSTSGSIVQRVDGFVDTLVTELEELDGLAGAVDVSGQQRWTQASSEPAKVRIVVTVPPTTSQADIQSAATSVLSTTGLVALFAANQDAVNGVISATGDATALDRSSGTYKDLLVVGFDAGRSQKDAVSSGAFLGSVTQDPYQMGYQAVTLAVRAANGETVQDVDTGSHWYTASNIDDTEISELLYD
ncbi:LacI family transcriptional regulator [Actinomyces sp. 2119]|uniref:substrate-binding domain-containing protein n=1 Tax=Actinomyces sp. 2119 TaxID=2321393 RepID=UPI000E6B8B49|nr:substrate-binding domain-containing protein [Actinomyces sp. 2119]RJF42506.1 LacI family transcriptional regulator [Actinomyces sp. 2119]